MCEEIPYSCKRGEPMNKEREILQAIVEMCNAGKEMKSADFYEQCWDDAFTRAMASNRPQVECYDEVIKERIERDESMIIRIKNETNYKIDLCCGIDQEFTLEPDGMKAVKVQYGDYVYIDQAIED